MFEKYKNELVKFTGYYKYTFTFMTPLQNGNTLVAQVGGCADSIYTFAVSSDMMASVYTLQPYRLIEISDGEIVDTWEEGENFDE